MKMVSAQEKVFCVICVAKSDSVTGVQHVFYRYCKKDAP